MCGCGGGGSYSRGRCGVVGRTTNLLDLQEQQETCMYMYMYGESLFALTFDTSYRLGMSI